MESQFCLKCGNSLPYGEDVPHQNICTNAGCDWHKTKFIYPDDARFCDVCGNHNEKVNITITDSGNAFKPCRL
jgi:hypothetical protein